ncbi:MAG: DUF4291 domain-containing protein [Acetatifactor sp.]|nr:DUF4291 domain-containing protein [Acetatifactor sp.]
MNQREIRAVYSEDTVRVYQAYSADIAGEAVKLGAFGPKFKMERMTWIKPSFLWMMYRCGWGTKENQEHILAIDIPREKFEFLVRNAVLSSYDDTVYKSREEWKEFIQHSEIRCQWDPERDIHGNALEYRSIQIGIRGAVVKEYVNEWLVQLTDITEYVCSLRKRKDMGHDIAESLPHEKVYRFLDGSLSGNCQIYG